MRFLITFGLMMIIIGIFYPQLQELGLGKIPGDFYSEKGNLKLYYPFTSSITSSCIINLIIYFYKKNN